MLFGDQYEHVNENTGASRFREIHVDLADGVRNDSCELWSNTIASWWPHHEFRDSSLRGTIGLIRQGRKGWPGNYLDRVGSGAPVTRSRQRRRGAARGGRVALMAPRPRAGAMASAGRNRARGGMARRRRPEGRRGPGRRRGRLAAKEAGPAVAVGAGPGRRCTRHQGAVGNLGEARPAAGRQCHGTSVLWRPIGGTRAAAARCRLGSGTRRAARLCGVGLALGSRGSSCRGRGWLRCSLASRWQRQWPAALTGRGMLSPRLQDRPGLPRRRAGIRSHSNSWYAGNKQPMHGGRRIYLQQQ
jgi:hypothetical protein